VTARDETRACRRVPVAHSLFGVERQPHFSRVVCDSLTAGIRPGSYADLATGLQRAVGHFNSDIGMTTRSALVTSCRCRHDVILAVARARGCAHARRVPVGVLEREARVLHARVLGLLAGEVGEVLGGAAEARRADLGAVAARQAALGDVVPARMLEVAEQQVADVRRRVEPADLLVGGPLHDRGGARDVDVAGPALWENSAADEPCEMR
jgi:hypothetical protein